MMKPDARVGCAAAVLAAAVSGVAVFVNSAYLGTEMWTTEEFSLEEQLTQCTRFCDYPTFDSAGTYHISDPFDATYSSSCYVPKYPELGDSGFPLDP